MLTISSLRQVLKDPRTCLIHSRGRLHLKSEVTSGEHLSTFTNHSISLSAVRRGSY